MRDYGPWKIRATATVYRDPWVAVTKDDVIRPDGEPGTYTVVHIKPGVSVLAVDTERVCHLTDEFHYAIGRHSLEVVSGGIEPDEDPQEAARRELQEEIGIEADRWTPLGLVDPFTSPMHSPTRLYLAQELQFVAAAPEGTERIRRVAVPLDEAVAMVMDGRITHAPSAVLILKAARVLLGEGLGVGE